MINRVQTHEDNRTYTTFSSDDAEEEMPSGKRIPLPEIEAFARKYPVAVMAIGLAAGLTFGWWVKRR